MHRISCSKSLHMFKLHFLQVVKINQSNIKAILPFPFQTRSRSLILGQTGLPFPYQNSRFVSINHPPEAKPSHLTPETLLWLHEIHQSFQHWPFLKLEAFMKCIGKHPKAPTFNIDVDTNKKVEKMKKDGKVLRFGFLWKGYVQFFKELQQCIPKEHQGFNPKIAVSLSVPLSKGSPQWLVQCFKFLTSIGINRDLL